MPYGDGAIAADMEMTVGIDCMQAAPHIVQPGAEPRKCVRLEVDVMECDRAGTGRSHSIRVTLPPLAVLIFKPA